MSVNLNESFLSRKASDYAILSELAYGNWQLSAIGDWVLVKGGAFDFDYDRYVKLWKDLEKKATPLFTINPTTLQVSLRLSFRRTAYRSYPLQVQTIPMM